MTRPPTFSVVISVFNQRERVLQAIESVQRQTIAAHEILVVDDGSTDGTAEAVTQAYPDVALLSQENLGKGIARNRGAYASSGEWVCFLDHDDLWHPEKLQTIAAYLRENPEAVAIDHWVWIFREGARGPDTAWNLSVDFTASTFDEAVEQMRTLGVPKNDFSFLDRRAASYDASLRRVFSTTSALSVRREAFFIAGGFPPGQANGEDWTLSINVARIGTWHTLPRALSCQRVLPGSGTDDPTAGVMILSSLAAHWYGGRPLRAHRPGRDFGQSLIDSSPAYVDLAQTVIWEALRKRRPVLAGRAVWFMLLVLPKWHDRLRALAPPPVTWRLDRFRRS